MDRLELRRRRSDIRARVGTRRRYVYVGALCHPLRPLYSTDSLLHYESTSKHVSLTSCVSRRRHPSSSQDLNQLSDAAVEEATGLAQIVSQPTRRPDIPDRVFVSRPMFRTVRVVTFVLSDDNKAVVAFAEHQRHTG